MGEQSNHKRKYIELTEDERGHISEAIVYNIQ